MIPVLYHNPRCSKSRQAFALLEEQGVQFQVVKYLDDPPDLDTLRQIAQALDEPVRALIRPKEPAWQQAGVDPDALSDEQLLTFAAANPSVLQRPILWDGRRARIGRPTEKILEVLNP